MVVLGATGKGPPAAGDKRGKSLFKNCGKFWWRSGFGPLEFQVIRGGLTQMVRVILIHFGRVNPCRKEQQ